MFRVTSFIGSVIGDEGTEGKLCLLDVGRGVKLPGLHAAGRVAPQSMLAAASQNCFS
jgi:hypothetical protein